MPAIGVNPNALQNGGMTIHGDGEGQHGTVNGISPIMGHFTLRHEGVSTIPIPVDASATHFKMALENLPSITVTGTKELLGITVMPMDIIWSQEPLRWLVSGC